MRNLRNIQSRLQHFPDGVLTATTFDGEDVICAVGPTYDNPTISLKRLSGVGNDDALELITSWDAPSPNPDLPNDRILNLHCFSDTRTLILVLEGGDLVVVRQNALPGEDLIEIVGTVDAGISAAQWSPDEELLAIVTKADTLLFMTKDFDGRANITLTAEDVKVSNHVSVGWGKKETQFKGRGMAKVLRDPTVPEHIDEGALSEADNKAVSITWRGDGEYLAVNAILQGDHQRRIIRVFTRQGVLESVSEPVDGMEGALSWKPSGQLIASVRRWNRKLEVIFFERNGLRHGEFDLRLTPDECESIGQDITLQWNVDSTVLAVILSDRVQLWTVGNYHYYMKQQIFLRRPHANGSMSFHWHTESPLRLLCHSGEELADLKYSSIVCRGSVISPHDLGLVAVIDGATLKITPLSKANIPPPMALNEVQLPETAVDVSFNSAGTELAVLHPSGKVSLWSCDYTNKHTVTFVESVQILSGSSDRQMLAQQIAATEDTSYVVLWNLDGESRISSLKSSASVSEEALGVQALTLVKSISNRLYVEDIGGIVYEVEHGIAVSASATLSVPCAHVEVWTSPAGETIAFGLSDQGTLYGVNSSQQLKLTGCTSFTITNDHLIYTTSRHLLKFIHLGGGGDLEVPADEPEKDERCRNVERGAKIVTVMPSTHSLVLQMPRGNLETIYPRALVLVGIRTHVANRNYKQAFMTCRTHRVDMNILHDYAPQQFLQDVDLFLKQIRKIEHVDLFLSSLSEEDVTETLYRDTSTSKMTKLKAADAPDNTLSSAKVSKVNRVCSAFLKELQHDSRRLQNTVTAHVSKNPPDLSAGLNLISGLRQRGEKDAVEQAIDHICFLADVNQLYDTALGLYDLDVALLVAQQSQKDPREYLPYLQNLHGLSNLRRRFRIDDDLQRYPSALGQLHEMNEFEEFKAYMAQHTLYSTALELYRYDKTRVVEIMRMYATYCSAQNKHKDAGIAFEFVGDWSAASEAYRTANMWQESLAAAGFVPLADEELQSLAADLALSLEESKDYMAAATIHMDYLGDLTNAVKLMCKAYHFSDAMRLAARKREPELIISTIEPGLIEASATMTELLAEMKTQLQNQVPRLRELRQKKRENPMAFLDGGGDGLEDGDIPDNISLAPTEASTTGTFMTRYTNRSTGTLATNATRRTSKNRRREERRRAKGKKGTVYEEEYLVNSIARLIERLNATSEDVTRLVAGLMRRAMRERAIAVESAMQDVHSACQSCLGEVFETPAVDASKIDAQDGGDAVERPGGGQGVLWESLHTQGRLQAPVIQAFERLSLL